MNLLPLPLVHFACLWYGFYGAYYHAYCYELYALPSGLVYKLLWRGGPVFGPLYAYSRVTCIAVA